MNPREHIAAIRGGYAGESDHINAMMARAFNIF